MKIILLFAWLLLPGILLAQEAAEPFKDSNLIVVESELPPATALKQVALLLQEKGYFIQKYDPELQSLIADKTSTERDGILYRIQILAQESSGTRLHFFGDFRSGSENGDYFGVAQFDKGILKKSGGYIFDEIIKLAKAVPGKRLWYSKL